MSIWFRRHFWTVKTITQNSRIGFLKGREFEIVDNKTTGCCGQIVCCILQHRSKCRSQYLLFSGGAFWGHGNLEVIFVPVRASNSHFNFRGSLKQCALKHRWKGNCRRLFPNQTLGGRLSTRMFWVVTLAVGWVRTAKAQYKKKKTLYLNLSTLEELK